MVGEGLSTNNGEGGFEQTSSEQNATTYQNLGEQVDFNPERAERLRRGEEFEDNLSENESELAEGIPDSEAELETNQENSESDDNTESPAERRERLEKELDGREKSSAEQKLDAVQEKLNQIEKELASTNESKEELEEKIAALESALKENTEQHNQLSDKIDRLKLEVKKTRRSVVTGFTNGLRLAKNLVLGRHDEARRILGEIGENINANENALAEHAETETALQANESEKEILDNEYADANDEKEAYVSRISRLERQKSATLKQIEMLKEEVANEAWKDAWVDAQEGIKAEMGTDNMRAFRDELSAQKEELSEQLEADLAELDGYREPSRALRYMYNEEELQERARRADIAEPLIRSDYNDDVAVLDAKREKVDRYFPTWLERVKNIKENNLVRGALSTFKRKALMRMYGIA